MNIDPNKPAAADESGVRELFRELPQPQPPAALDEAIRLAARQALRNDARVVPLPARRWQQRLVLPLSIAATVVLSFGVVLRLAQQPAAEYAASAPAAVPLLQPAPPAAEVPAVDVATTPAAEAKPAAAPAVAEPASRAARSAESITPARPRQAASAPAVADQAVSGLPMSPAAPPPVAPALPQPAPAPARPSAEGEAPAAAAPAPQPAAEAMADRAAERSIAPAPQKSLRALMAKPAAGTGNLDAELAEIRRLLAAGEHERARVAWQHLIETRPQAVLPDDLRRHFEPAPASR